MGKYYQARLNASSRFSSSSRGGGVAGSNGGRVESRRTTTDFKSKLVDSRGDARFKLINQRRDRFPDARDILRQQARKPTRVSKSSPVRSRDIRSKPDMRNGSYNDRDARERYARHGSESSKGFSSIRGHGDSRGRANNAGRSMVNTRRRSRTRNSYNNDSKSPDRSRSCNRVDRDRRSDYSSKKEPFVVVTGLGNVRKDGHSIRSVNERPRDGRDHFVTNNGHNTLVTLNNEQFRNSRGNDSSMEKQPQEKKPAYEAIKIKITNTNYISKEKNDYARSESNEDQSPDNRDNFSFPTPSSIERCNFLPKSEDSMECETSNEPPRFQQPNVNVSLPNNMYASIMSTRPALLPNPPASTILTNSLTSMNGYNSALNSFKPAGLIVNNFPTGGMYSSNYDTLWNSNLTNFYNQQKSSSGIASTATAVTKPSATPVSKDGYKLLVSNLHHQVTEDDVLELFSDIGPIKRARFIDKGLAEVVYVRIEHAKEAIKKYDLKELDGRQMVIGFADKSYLSSSEAITNNPVANNYENKFTTNKIDAPKQPINIKVPPPAIIPGINNRTLFSGNPASLLAAPPHPIAAPVQNLSLTIRNNNPPTQQYNSNLLSLTQPPAIPSNKLSSRFKDRPPQILLPESKHTDKTQSINGIDNSIIQQVLFNKKNIATNPVTFTVKL